MGPAPYRRLFVFFVSDRLIDVTDGGADQTAQGAAQDGARAADLLARGDLQGAAAALRRAGDWARALDLYERLGLWREAAEIASEQGDLLGLLRVALRTPDRAQVEPTLAVLRRGAPDTVRAAAAICESARDFACAAVLLQGIGDTARAHELYVRAGDLLSAAMLDEQAGRLREAIAGYRSHLRATHAQGAAGSGVADALFVAHGGLGRLLLRVGQAEAAIPHLQVARRLLGTPGDRRPAGSPHGDAASSTESSASASPDAVRVAVDAALIECFLAIDEGELASRLFDQLSVWHGDAARAGSAVEFTRRRASAVAGGTQARGAGDALLLGRYRLGRLLGVGSVGRVYLAEDLLESRPVALKLLSLAGAQSALSRTLYARFCREASLLAALRHPQLMAVHAFFPTAGVMALEFMPGGACSELSRPLPLVRMRRLLLDVIEALLCMHAAGVLHRDVKPHNVFVSATGGAKLGDFGVASLRELGVTQTEGLVGTLSYMAPEQIRGTALSVGTDVYGLGATAFELLTGQLPFPGPDFIAGHLDAPPPDACAIRPSLPPVWGELLRRMLAKEPADRCDSLESLRATVRALPTPPLADDFDVAHGGAVLTSPGASASDAAMAATGAATGRAAVGEGGGGVSLPGQDGNASPDPARVIATPYSEVVRSTDARLGRAILIERFAPGVLQSDVGAVHLAWLRALARLAGPGLQRILRIDLGHGGAPAGGLGVQVHYEDIGRHGAIAAVDAVLGERQMMARILSRMHAAGIVHGAVATSLWREPAHLSLQLHARGPLAWAHAGVRPGAADDLAAFAVPDEDDPLT